ncbi:HNH endonuclease [Yersinia enterocolitica]|nr:HNH endonuclease [Yersinia enterocolitica]
MNFQDFVAIINQRQAELKDKGLKSNITQAQWKILEHLFNQGSTFPRAWVPRDVLHDLVKQSDYRRRITELGDEVGVDIQRQPGTNAYRLNSLNLNIANPRTYLSKNQKDSLILRQNYTCQVCSLHDNGNSTGTLQADHKIPLARGGGHSIENWQTLCHVCNVGKRNACQGCNRDCHQCPWAFPEIYGIRIMAPLSPNDIQRIMALGIPREGIPNWLVQLVQRELKN